METQVEVQVSEYWIAGTLRLGPHTWNFYFSHAPDRSHPLPCRGSAGGSRRRRRTPPRIGAPLSARARNRSTEVCPSPPWRPNVKKWKTSHCTRQPWFHTGCADISSENICGFRRLCLKFHTVDLRDNHKGRQPGKAKRYKFRLSLGPVVAL